MAIDLEKESKDLGKYIDYVCNHSGAVYHAV